MLNKKTVDLLKKIQTDFNSGLSNLDLDNLSKIDKSIEDLGNHIEEMKKNAIEEIQNSNLVDENKAYLVRFIKNPDSEVEDLLDLKLEFKAPNGTNSVSPNVNVTTDHTELK